MSNTYVCITKSPGKSPDRCGSLSICLTDRQKDRQKLAYGRKEKPTDRHGETDKPFYLTLYADKHSDTCTNISACRQTDKTDRQTNELAQNTTERNIEKSRVY